MRKFFQISLVSIAGLMAAGGTAMAAANVSGDVGYNYNSHFVSYGVDVWGEGGKFFGNRDTSSIYGDLAVKATDSLSVTLNAWSDINNNTKSGIGGNLQEIDINPGLAYSFGHGFSGTASFGAWSYGGDVEEVVDLGLGFDDTDMLAKGFALNPHLGYHQRVSGNNGQKIGSAVSLSVGPSFPLFDSFTLSIPAGVSFFTTSDFQGGKQGGVGYGWLGGSLGTPLSFIPAEDGAWSANFDLIGYFTNHDAIPSNPAANFVTGSFNIKVGF